MIAAFQPNACGTGCPAIAGNCDSKIYIARSEIAGIKVIRARITNPRQLVKL